MKYKSIIMAISILCAAPVYADTVYINLGGVSHHFSEHKYNDNNYGLGIEIPAGGMLVGAGVYKNSIGQVSRYLVAEKCMLPVGPACIGVMAGFVDGYHLNQGGFIPMVAPTITVEDDIIGLRAVFVPGLDDRSEAVVSLQARIKITTL